MKRSTSRMLIGLVAGTVFLLVVAWRLEWDRVGDSLAAAKLEFLAPIALLLTAHYFFKALRWQVLLSKAVDISPVLAMRLTMIGFLMNNVLPARIGEVGRPYLLSVNRPQVSFPFALATVVGDKLFDLLLNILTLLVLSFLLPLSDYARIGILVAAGAGIGVLGLSFCAAVFERHERESGGSRIVRRLLSFFGSRQNAAHDALLGFAQGLATISSARRAAIALGFSLAALTCLGGAIWLTLAMLNLSPSPLTVAAVIGLTGIGFILPAPPTNAGNYHFFASAALTVSMTVGADEAFSFALASHVCQVGVVTALGAVSLIGLDWRRISRIDRETARAEDLAPR